MVDREMTYVQASRQGGNALYISEDLFEVTVTWLFAQKEMALSLAGPELQLAINR
jgi:hypothetical protein